MKTPIALKWHFYPTSTLSMLDVFGGNCPRRPDPYTTTEEVLHREEKRELMPAEIPSDCNFIRFQDYDCDKPSDEEGPFVYFIKRTHTPTPNYEELAAEWDAFVAVYNTELEKWNKLKKEHDERMFALQFAEAKAKRHAQYLELKKEFA